MKTNDSYKRYVQLLWRLFLSSGFLMVCKKKRKKKKKKKISNKLQQSNKPKEMCFPNELLFNTSTVHMYSDGLHSNLRRHHCQQWATRQYGLC